MSKDLNKGKRLLDSASEINKTLLIIKSQQQSITGVEKFLRNREWNIFSTTNIKDALAHIVKNQPAFVMISVDHSNKKVQKLARVLPQAFPCCVIMFAENSTAASMRILTEARAEYNLYPPVTGPAFERAVNKFYKDQNAKSLNQNSTERTGTLGTTGDDKLISIKGNAAAGQNLLAQLMGDDNAATSFSTSEEGDPLNHIGGINSGTNSANGYMPGSGSGNENFNPHSSSNTQDPTSGFMGGGNGNTEGGQHYAPNNPNPSHYNPQNGLNKKESIAAHYNPQSGDETNNPHSSGQAGYNPQAKGHYNPNQNLVQTPNSNNQDPNSANNPHGQNPQESNNSTHGGYLPDEPTQHNKSSFEKSLAKTLEADDANETVVSRGTKDSLEKTVIRGSPNELDEPLKIEDSSNVACITIESGKFSGYLVAAMGKNRKIDDSFVESIRLKLFKFLSDNGEPVKNQEKDMQLKIKVVPFEDWAMECADFLRKSVHDNNEIAMAFFPYADIQAKFKNSASEEMTSVALEDIKSDAEVEFNVYLYLNTNQKYVLYTPKGGKLYGKQKDKLLKEGITHVHMLKQDVQDFKKYRAQNFLNDKVDEYEAKKATAEKLKKVS